VKVTPGPGLFRWVRERQGVCVRAGEIRGEKGSDDDADVVFSLA